jgi:hypothetical protein
MLKINSSGAKSGLFFADKIPAMRKKSSYNRTFIDFQHITYEKGKNKAYGGKIIPAGLTDLGDGGRMRLVEENEVGILCQTVMEADKSEAKVDWNL